MRNHITPQNAAWPNASQQASFTAGATNSNVRLELVHDTSEVRSMQSASTRRDVVVKPASDFEGFGSFSG